MSKFFDRMDIMERLRIYDAAKTYKYEFDVTDFASNYTISFPMMTTNDTFTFNSHTQTIENKTIMGGVGNTARATRLATAGADVTLTGPAPIAGNILSTTSATEAAWGGGNGITYIGNAQHLSEEGISGSGSSTELTYNTPNLALGTYRVGWCFEHKMVAGLLGSTHRVYTYIDNTSNRIGETVVTSTVTSDLYSLSGGKYLWENVSGTHTIGIRQQISSLLGSADVRNMHIELFRIS